jgi:hypothetical protein
VNRALEARLQAEAAWQRWGHAPQRTKSGGKVLVEVELDAVYLTGRADVLAELESAPRPAVGMILLGSGILIQPDYMAWRAR